VKITLGQLKKIIKEYGDYHSGRPGTYGQRLRDARQSNGLPPIDSNWHGFAKALDLGVLDLEDLAIDMGFKSFEHMDASISPRRLSDEKVDKILDILSDEYEIDEIEIMDALDAPYMG